MNTEVRVTDPATGGEKGTKLQRFSLIPRDFLWALAEHYGKGARKYADRNWERGYQWHLTLDAHDRHLGAWLHGTPENGWMPEDNDPETGSSHLVAAVWHLITLWWFQRYGRGTDNIRHTVGPVDAFKDVAAQVCCGDYAACTQACTPRGEWRHKHTEPMFVCPQDGEVNCCPGLDENHEWCQHMADKRRREGKV